MYFGTKNYLKNNRNHTVKHAHSQIEGTQKPMNSEEKKKT